MDGKWYNLVQPYQHHENVPTKGICVYSFALKPEEHQPSGTCNMSRIDAATLNLTLTPKTINLAGTPRTAKIRIYAVNYNVLRLMSGMGKRQTAHNSWLPHRLQFIPLWINSVRTVCTLFYTYNQLVKCIRILQHFQIAGNSLEPLLPRSNSKGLTGHGNTVGYGNNVKDWTIRSQAPKVPCHGQWRRFREQTEMGNEVLTKPMNSIRCAPRICESKCMPNPGLAYSN